MTDTFQTRLPDLTEAELWRYVTQPQNYRTEAVEAAAAELVRRGQPLPPEVWEQVRSCLAARVAAHQGPAGGALLGTTPATRRTRIRGILAGLLTSGLGSALVLFWLARPQTANPLGYDPLDTKKHLRDLELYGGRANVLATEFRRWFDGLWQGRNLAYTVACLTVVAAFAFWFVATRLTPVGDDTGSPTSHGA